MPGMDGLAATREIRKFDETGNMPIIAVSAHGKWFYEQAIEAGCNDLINKPANSEDLEPLLDRYLS
jgi:CheY-like chemotaxis protein